MEYKKITQKDYLNLLKTKDKSLFIGTFQNHENIENCYKEIETLLNRITKENIKECYDNQTFIKLVSGEKKSLKFSNNKDNSFIYGDLSGLYYIFDYKGFEFLLNVVIDENLKNKNFNLYTINLSFLESKKGVKK